MIRANVQTARTEIEKAHDRLSSVLERLAGPTPEAAQTTAAPCAGLADEANAMAMRAGALHEKLTCLERLLFNEEINGKLAPCAPPRAIGR